MKAERTVGPRDLWLLQAGTESRCDPLGNGACSSATPTCLRCPFPGQSLFCSGPKTEACEQPGSLARSSRRNCSRWSRVVVSSSALAL